MARARAARFAVAVLLLAPVAARPAAAQAIRCSTFLHNRDGSWTSFWDGVVFGSFGPVPIHTGERFRVGAVRVKDDVARILNEICARE